MTNDQDTQHEGLPDGCRYFSPNQLGDIYKGDGCLYVGTSPLPSSQSFVFAGGVNPSDDLVTDQRRVRTHFAHSTEAYDPKAISFVQKQFEGTLPVRVYDGFSTDAVKRLVDSRDIQKPIRDLDALLVKVLSLFINNNFYLK
jgi:hypothetical protein